MFFLTKSLKKAVATIGPISIAVHTDILFEKYSGG